MKTAFLFFVVCSLLGCLSLVPATAQQFVDGASACGGNTPCYSTIQAAIDAATVGDTIRVYPGTYVENVGITKGISLISTGGFSATKIVGTQTTPAPSTYGAVLVDGSTANVSIGTSVANGFTIVGVDWPTNVTDVGAVYVRGGPHTNLSIIGNNIQANGDNGFVLQYATPVNGFVFSNNILSGQTYLGNLPNQICCSSTCYFDNTSSNVARALFALNPGASNVTFTHNIISGSSGAGSNGNIIVQFEATTALIQSNVFMGATVSQSPTCNRGHLRIRGSAITVVCNTFNNSRLTGAGLYNILFDQNNTPLTGANAPENTLAGVAANNTYSSNPVAYYSSFSSSAAVAAYQRAVFVDAAAATPYAAFGGGFTTVTGSCSSASACGCN